MSAPVITLIGGPTTLIEANGFRLITDPTFDAPGEYNLPHVTLKKLTGPARTAEHSFRALGIGSRLRLLEPGVPTTIAAS